MGLSATNRLLWERDGYDWPNREASRFVEAAGLRWHVQQLGQGPVLLLIHGTGAATHSWRDLAPLLAAHFTVIAADLPGHGFTETPPPERLSLPGMAQALDGLLQTLELKPVMAAGHSAGAAILARMCLDRMITPQLLVSLNGALLPLRGMAGQIFSPVAKLFAANTLVPRLFAWRAGDHAAVERLIASTGSKLDARGVGLYARLVRNPAHVAGVLGMMANWDIKPLAYELPYLTTPLVLIVGAGDKTVPADDAARVRMRLPAARIIPFAGLGHLAHEECPQAIADLLIQLAHEAHIVVSSGTGNT
jgi:magnesium chelatase accessory protein